MRASGARWYSNGDAQSDRGTRKVVWTGRCDWDCDSVLARIARLGLLYGHRSGELWGRSLTGGVSKNGTGEPRLPFSSPLARARALMARPWSARCYGVARQREGSRQNSIGGSGVLSLRHFSGWFSLSLNPLARGCRRIWRGEVWKYGFGGAVADFVLVISGSRRRPRRSQVRGQLRHDPIATAG